jgi:hypothetical protein
MRHGMTKTRIYKTWFGMMDRCRKPTHQLFELYGGRGITVCERWHLFENFYADMGDKPGPGYSIERKDNDGNYCPENCVWATAKDQARNRRNITALTWRGKTQTVSAWAEELGMLYVTLKQRLRTGKPLDDILTRPVQKYEKRKAL